MAAEHRVYFHLIEQLSPLCENVDIYVELGISSFDQFGREWQMTYGNAVFDTRSEILAFSIGNHLLYVIGLMQAHVMTIH